MSVFETGDIIMIRNSSDTYYCVKEIDYAIAHEFSVLDLKAYNGYTSRLYQNISRHERNGKLIFEDKIKEANKYTAIDTKVLVWNHGAFEENVITKTICKRYFKEIKGSKYICFEDGSTSFTAECDEEWNYAVIYEDGMLD